MFLFVIERLVSIEILKSFLFQQLLPIKFPVKSFLLQFLKNFLPGALVMKL